VVLLSKYTSELQKGPKSNDADLIIAPGPACGWVGMGLLLAVLLERLAARGCITQVGRLFCRLVVSAEFAVLGAKRFKDCGDADLVIASGPACGWVGMGPLLAGLLETLAARGCITQVGRWFAVSAESAVFFALLCVGVQNQFMTVVMLT
jgi:hypothetical protein